MFYHPIHVLLQMLCKLGFGAEFWRVGPTVRTGQSHISRAFMCANTRLLYLSPNMSAPLVLTAAQRPDSHQNIDPCHHDCASPRTKNAPLRSFSPAFLGRSMPMAGVLSDFWGWFEATKKWIYSIKKYSCLFLLCLATLAWTIKFLYLPSIFSFS